MLRLTIGNAQHIGARKEQQDSFAFSNVNDFEFAAHGGLLGIVADGMGGLEGGQHASRAAVSAFLASFSRKTPQESIPAALRRSLEEANRAVLTVARSIGMDGKMGTTLAAVAVHNDVLYWIASGDSRIYLLRDNQLIRINADHTYINDLWSAVAAGRLDREDALRDPDAPHLTSHLGMDHPAIIDLSQRAFPLRSDDVVIICSDGIYRGISEEDIAAAFREEPPTHACGKVQAKVLAKAHSKQDNLTIIAIQCRDDRPAVLKGNASKQSSPQGAHRLVMSVALMELVLFAGLGVYSKQAPLVRWLNQHKSRMPFAHQSDSLQGGKSKIEPGRISPQNDQKSTNGDGSASESGVDPRGKRSHDRGAAVDLHPAVPDTKPNSASPHPSHTPTTVNRPGQPTSDIPTTEKPSVKKHPEHRPTSVQTSYPTDKTSSLLKGTTQ